LKRHNLFFGYVFFENSVLRKYFGLYLIVRALHESFAVIDFIVKVQEILFFVEESKENGNEK
jgi:hypothetical protein